MNLERVDQERSAELSLPEGSKPLDLGEPNGMHRRSPDEV